MSPTFDPTSVLDDDLPGTVLRRASAGDVDAIIGLVRRAWADGRRPDRAHLAHLVHHGWFLVVESADGELIGAVHVRMQRTIGHVSLLMMDPRHRGHGLATRLLGVADALCAVFGCTPYEELEIHAAA
ncbi:MAG: GNAT family N-acetyltransferase [Deltaproteobacteria bacterium]|nr:GNAT family N-acetyltransferase [Kofleriaceae bacterium]